MSTWILLVLVHSLNPTIDLNVAMTNVPGFKTKDDCYFAGKKAEGIAEGTKKFLSFQCLEQKK
jgi:hypothetical protein